LSAHGVDIAQGISCRNASKEERIIHNRCDNVHRLDEADVVSQLIDPGVIPGLYANEEFDIPSHRKILERFFQVSRTQLGRSTGFAYNLSKFYFF
jgi:hypothetical protein